MTKEVEMSGTVNFLIHFSTTRLDDDDISRFAAANQQVSTIRNVGEEDPACIGHLRGHGFILSRIRDWFFMPQGTRFVDDFPCVMFTLL